MHEFRYVNADPSELEKIVAHDLTVGFRKRGARVFRRGGEGEPGIVVDAGDFCIVVELTKLSGADATREYRSVRGHREQVESDLGKPAYLLFSCMSTPNGVVPQVVKENVRLASEGSAGRVLFLDLSWLEAALDRLAETPFDSYPNERWKDWFAAWSEIGDDLSAAERLRSIVLAEDADFRGRVESAVTERSHAEQEGLSKDVRKLENLLRQRRVTGPDAMRTLIYLMFIKLYEEKRELAGLPNRFTAESFPFYRASVPDTHSGHAVHHLLEREIKADRVISECGILKGATLSERLTDSLVEGKILPVLDLHRFRGTRLDPLGAVFEAVARRPEKDTRIGQFFTPEPIVRFAVDVVRPGPTEIVLDPAAGTGRFLSVSMEAMADRAGEVPHVRRDEVVRAIQGDRLLGSDTDEWIATIARMNLYIQSEGESQIQVENGLFLADAPVFRSGPLRDAVDVCVTNPPLGPMNYRDSATELFECYSPAFADASEWLRKRLPMLPGEYEEEKQIREAEARIAKSAALAREAERRGEVAAGKRALASAAKAEAAMAQARERLAAGRGKYVTRGESAKGGALFLAAIHGCLKPVRDPGAPPEWRGGRLGIIVDEAILNTPEYAETRRFIRRHYFVKAVFSFHRDAFWYQARTTAKTSLLYLVRKEDDAVRQQEPVFYAHVDRIGFTRTGKHTYTDLPRTLRAYREFEDAVRASYRAGCFDTRAARAAVGAAELSVAEAFVQWPGEVEEGARLDYAAEAARHVRASLPADLQVLGDFLTLEVRNPPEDRSRIYPFATVNRKTGEVREARTERTAYSTSDLRVIREGDVVVSGIDLVNGAVGYAGRAVAGRVVSKEFYTLALRPECAGVADARYLALLLRTPNAAQLIAGSVTGTSNRTRIEDASALLNLPVPPLPTLQEQRKLASRVERALETRNEMRAELSRALAAANRRWSVHPRPAPEPRDVAELALV